MNTKELSFAVIGWGYWGPKIARNIDSLPHASVAMVADLDARRLAGISLQQPWIQTTTQLEDVFRSDVDAVVIGNPQPGLLGRPGWDSKEQHDCGRPSHQRF